MFNALIESTGLTTERDRMRSVSLAALAGSEDRASYVLETCDLTVDMTRHLIDDAILGGLLDIAARQGFEAQRAALFAGDKVNNTEGRAALHTALRAEPEAMPDDVRAVILDCRTRMAALVTQILDGRRVSATGQPFTRVIAIGIGGSDLGPRMAARALAKPGIGLPVHFVSNVDPEDIGRALAQCSPDTTLVIVSSKTFTTQETLLNAGVARRWLADAVGETGLPHHLCAVTTAVERAEAFGIRPDSVLPMWDWVGGRYSVWSAIGLPLMLAIGPAAFDEFLAGARAMDTHFRDTPSRRNVPLLMAALTVWYRNLWGCQTHGVIAYEQRLEYFVDHLQQLDMESLGKSVNRNGDPLACDSGGVVWGGVGTNTQHSFHQLLHQGTLLAPIDLLVGMASDADLEGQHAVLLANCLAQSSAFLHGLIPTPDDPAGQHRAMPGGRPHSLITYPRLTPGVLGQLIALYEHKVFCQAVFWGINPFDQYGVELGKKIGTRVLAALNATTAEWALEADTLLAGFDPAMQGLIRRQRRMRGV